MSLTSVFGMGTGGPSSQSIPTIMDGFETIIYVKTFSGSNYISSIQIYLISHISYLISLLLVTRTGFEPMLKA